MTSDTSLYNLTVEGYRFYRSDGEPFDSSVMTFVPPYNVATEVVKPSAETIKCVDSESYMDSYYHACVTENTGSFTLARRCEPSWSSLSDQQKDVIEKVEEEVRGCRRSGIYFRSVIMEGLGGCGKTRLMAYIMNHSPSSTHVMYLTKQNKRLQDFLYDEIGQGELISPPPVADMSKSSARDFDSLLCNDGGRYACTVEKLVYNKAGFAAARQTNSREALQWKMKIPDVLFGKDLADRTSNAVILLDEYTMISPPLLHKMLHCVRTLFQAPTVLIMGGDQFQLGPIDWDAQSDKCYRDKCGEEAPVDAITANNEYYVSDVREELTKRLGQAPFEYHMEGSQRCRDDPELAKMVVYLRNSCKKRTSVKAIERKLVAFGRARGVSLYRYDDNRRGCKTGQLVFEKDDDLGSSSGSDDDDQHLGDNDSYDTLDMEVDWSSPPAMDMTPFIDFYGKLYWEIYLRFNDGTLNETELPSFVYEKASRFALAKFPIFIVKKNDKCNILSDTFLKTLYNGIYTKLNKKYADKDNVRIGIKQLLEKLCVSMSMANQGPVQQTLMTGVPYRMTETIKKWNKSPVVSNGELVLLTGVMFDKTRAVKNIVLKTLQRNTDHFLLVSPGFTQNRLVETEVNRTSDSFFENDLFFGTAKKARVYDAGGSYAKPTKQIAETHSERIDGKGQDTRLLRPAPVAVVAFMLPMVPMICENIYQMQGNTIVSDCFIDLLSTKQDDIYVAVSRFKKTSSIRGIILSQ